MSCSHQLIKLLRLPQQYFNLPNKMTLMSENYRCYYFINELKCSLVTTWYLYFTNFYKVKYIFQFLSVFNKFAIKSVKCILHSLSNFAYMWAPFIFWGQIALLHMVFFFFVGVSYTSVRFGPKPQTTCISCGVFSISISLESHSMSITTNTKAKAKVKAYMAKLAPNQPKKREGEREIVL